MVNWLDRGKKEKDEIGIMEHTGAPIRASSEFLVKDNVDYVALSTHTIGCNYSETASDVILAKRLQLVSQPISHWSNINLGY